MPTIKQTGSDVEVEFIEPDQNADTTPLTDLKEVQVKASVNGLPETVVATVPASGPTGGQPQVAKFTIPVPPEGAVQTIIAEAFAVDTSGNFSVPSEQLTLTIDLLAPAPPK